MSRAHEHSPDVRNWHAAALMAAMLVLAACARGPATIDGAALAVAGAGTLEVIGTRAAEQETLTATALWPTDTATPTDTPTSTATPSPTSTDTPTPTPLPSGTVAGEVRLRAGPGTVYPTVASLAGGEAARALGQTEAGNWLLIVLDNGEEGWLPAENFTLASEAIELPVITDLPPTPTVSPATLTPTVPPPTATSTKSPYTCDLSITRDGSHIILVGQNWPPSAPITFTVTRVIAGASQMNTYLSDVMTGDADDQLPNGFWIRMPSGTVINDGGIWRGVDGPTTYALSTWACTGTATTSP